MGETREKCKGERRRVAHAVLITFVFLRVSNFITIQVPMYPHIMNINITSLVK
jgi:hypothetical protein